MTRRLLRGSRTTLAFALALLLTGAPAHAQRPGQRAANGADFTTGGNYAGRPPAGANMGVGNAGGYGNYGFNNYGFGGYGNYGYGYPLIGGLTDLGYGGYGGYGGLGYGVYGGGYGGYGGIGTTIGMTFYDQQMIKEQQYMLNASQYDLANAQATQAYQAANLYNQQAMNQMYLRYAAMRGATANGAANSGGSDSASASTYQTRYNLNNGNTTPYPVYNGNHNRRINRTRLPREQVLADDGKILWPSNTPTDQELDPLREAVDTAFRDVAADRDKHKRTNITIRDAVHARSKLVAFAAPAVEKLSEEKSEDLADFQVFLGSLDYALRNMANAAPLTASTRTNPDNTPESGGDVLKDTIKKDRPAPATRTTPDDAPKSAGDVLKETIKADKEKGKE